MDNTIKFIELIGPILAAAIPGLVGICYLKVKHTIAKLKHDYSTAMQDILCLLEVEQLHIEDKKNHGTLGKTNVRKLARERGYTWSGRFTASKIRYRQQQLTKPQREFK